MEVGELVKTQQQSIPYLPFEDTTENQESKRLSHTSNVVKSTINALYWNALDLNVYFLLV